MGVVRRLTDTLRLLRLSLRAERASSALLFVLLLVTVVLAAGVPALAERAAADGLRHALERATVAERNLSFSRQTDKLIDVVELDEHAIVPAEGDPLAAVERAGQELYDALPASIGAAVVDRQYIVETARYLARYPPQPGTHLNLRYQSGIDQHIRYVAGRPPTGDVERFRCPPAGECLIGPDNPPLTYEVALSRATAEALRLDVGDRLALMQEVPSPRPRPGVPPVPGDIGYVAVVVTGIYEVPDPTGDYWRDTALVQPTIQWVSIELSNYFATALVAGDTYRELPSQMNYTYAWRFTLDPARIDAGALAAFERDLRRLQARYPLRSPAQTVDSPSLSTGLSRVLDNYHAQRSSTEAALTVVAAGPLVAVGGSLVLVALLWVQRRQAGLLYLRQRGASSLQVLARATAEALLLGLPAAVLGFLAVAFLVGTRQAPAVAAAAAAAAALMVAIVVLAVLPTARASLNAAPADPAGTPEARRRRLVFDVLVIGLAAMGALLLSERGTGAAGGGVDPFLALVPALIGVAAGVLLLRLYPWPIRVLSWLVRRGRGLVGTHALRASAREAGLARLPLLVLLLAAALAVFSSGVLVTLERGQLASSWQQLGADYRIEARVGDIIPTQIQLSRIDGITVETRALLENAAVTVNRQRRDGITLLAVEPAEYEALLAGTPAATRLPPSFAGPWPPVVDRSAPPAMGIDEAPLPAVMSSGLAAAAGLARGEPFGLTIPGGRVVARVVEVRSTLPGLRETADFLLVPYPALRAAYPHRVLAPTLLLARGGPETEAGVRAQVATTQRVRLGITRHVLYGQLHDAPLARAISGGLELALVVTLAYGALGLGASAVLSLVARRRELALLRTLGVRRGQLLALLLLGQLPGVAAALVAGVALGLGLAWLLLPALGLEAFTGPGVVIAFQLEPIHVVLAVLVPGLVTIGLTLAGGWLITRDELATIIRGGEAQAVERR